MFGQSRFLRGPASDSNPGPGARGLSTDAPAPVAPAPPPPAPVAVNPEAEVLAAIRAATPGSPEHTKLHAQLVVFAQARASGRK